MRLAINLSLLINNHSLSFAHSTLNREEQGEAGRAVELLCRTKDNLLHISDWQRKEDLKEQPEITFNCAERVLPLKLNMKLKDLIFNFPTLSTQLHLKLDSSATTDMVYL